MRDARPIPWATPRFAAFLSLSCLLGCAQHAALTPVARPHASASQGFELALRLAAVLPGPRPFEESTTQKPETPDVPAVPAEEAPEWFRYVFRVWARDFIPQGVKLRAEGDESHRVSELGECEGLRGGGLLSPVREYSCSALAPFALRDVDALSLWVSDGEVSAEAALNSESAYRRMARGQNVNLRVEPKARLRN